MIKNLLDSCVFSVLSNDIIKDCNSFDCGNDDLNDFFHNDAPLYNKQLLGKTYCFRNEPDNKTIVCAFTVSNDSIRISNLPKCKGRKIKASYPRSKQISRYPAVLIGRLGVSIDYQHKSPNNRRLHIGTLLMDFIKAWFIESGNKTGCRYLIVDAYNEEGVLAYYKKNGFDYLFPTPEEEAVSTTKPVENLKTRLMFFDLITLSAERAK